MHEILARLRDPSLSNPPAIFPFRPCLSVRRYSVVSRRKVDTRAKAEPTAWLRTPRTFARIIVAIAPSVCLAAALTMLEPPARAQTAGHSEAADRFAKFIDEASNRFAVPGRWIRAVMRVESGGDEHSISSRGAMGLMQLMPGTWVELSARHGLGLDPFDPRENILAGVAYLKEMHDRFGSAGFLSAYHAGPARYEQHLATGRPLPQETTAYVAAVTPLLDSAQTGHTEFRFNRAVPWREAPLFVERAGAR